jgi:3-phenylpropionate/cinnamic acid dioxygenase small subunit
MDLQQIADRLAIVDLLHRYATGLDSRDWDLLASVFTEDGVADYGALGGVNRGPAAIVALCRGALQGLDASQHIIANEVIAIDGDEARARCYFQAQHVYAGAAGGDTYLVGGTYEDEVVRTAEGWRIRHRTLVPTWTDGNPGVFEAASARLAAASGT